MMAREIFDAAKKADILERDLDAFVSCVKMKEAYMSLEDAINSCIGQFTREKSDSC